MDGHTTIDHHITIKLGYVFNDQLLCLYWVCVVDVGVAQVGMKQQRRGDVHTRNEKREKESIGIVNTL